MFIPHCKVYEGFPGNSGVKNPPANAGDVGSITGSGRSHARKMTNLFQYSCPGYCRDRGAWQAIQFMGL